jgi:hypothetical protein
MLRRCVLYVCDGHGEEVWFCARDVVAMRARDVMDRHFESIARERSIFFAFLDRKYGKNPRERKNNVLEIIDDIPFWAFCGSVGEDVRQGVLKHE